MFNRFINKVEHIVPRVVRFKYLWRIKWFWCEFWLDLVDASEDANLIIQAGVSADVKSFKIAGLNLVLPSGSTQRSQ